MEVHNSDWQLLRDYVEHGSQAAFASLVKRHINFVYSTCLREVRNAALAEDVTQVVFLILARKAPGLRESGAFSGWLYQTSRFACKNAMRQELNRQRHEQDLLDEVMAHEVMAEAKNPTPNADWALIEDLLHDALSHLNANQRSVILLRFFEGKSVREVAESLGITEKTAEGRLTRALDKMRRYFASFGYKVSVIALATLLLENATQAAPAACVVSALQLAGSVSAGGAVVTTATGTATGVATMQIVSLSEGVLKAMLISQIKTGIVASIGLFVMAGSTVKIAHYAMAAQQKTPSPTSLSIVSARKVTARPILRTATPRTAALQTKKQSKKPATALPAPIVLTRSRVRLAQPTVPIAPAEKPIKPEVVTTAPRVETTPVRVAVPVTDMMPQKGEIAVEGPLIAIKNQRYIIDVNSYTLPNGKTSEVKPPKPKVILFSPQTVLHVRRSAVPVKFHELTPDAFLRAVGSDKGSGEPLSARDIGVWHSEKNGVYSWNGNRGQQAVPAVTQLVPPTTIIETADDADTPPPGENRPYENVFPQGDFQKTTPGQLPPGWKTSPDIKARVHERNGQSWLALTNNSTKNWGTVRYDLPVRAEWKRVRVSAQLKTKNLKRGKDWWSTARLDFNVYDAKNQALRSSRGLNLWASSNWTTLSKFIEVPAGATRITLEPGFFYATGELLIDNIRVEANSPLEARPIRAGFPEGTFEKTEGSGWPDGFEPWTTDAFQIVTENGNHFLRIVNNKPDSSIGGAGKFQLPPEWKAFRLRAKMRAENLKIGEQVWENARVTLKTMDTEGEIVGSNLSVVQLREDSDWKVVETINPIAAGAAILEVLPQLTHATGVLDVDDIEITDATNDELPHFEITPDLPPGQFEDLDENGWPRGWIQEAGKSGKFQVGEENGNHFLRLSSPEIRYVAAKCRFKLPPDWRAIQLKGRLRVKNLQREPNAEGWKTARVGISFQSRHGAPTGGFQQSLKLDNDSAWKELEVKVDIPRDAAYIELAALLQNCAGIFDVDDLKIEKATAAIKLDPIYEWTRAFPEGTFESKDENGAPLHWTIDNRAQILQEDGNKFLRLSSENARDTVLVSGQWKIEPEWKSIRVRARMRGANLQKGPSPFDGARIQILFMDTKGTILNPVPALLELQKDSDWIDLQTQTAIPPGAVRIRLLPSLSRTSGLFDVDDVLIKPVGN